VDHADDRCDHSHRAVELVGDRPGLEHLAQRVGEDVGLQTDGTSTTVSPEGSIRISPVRSPSASSRVPTVAE